MNNTENNLFSWYDYFGFVLMLLISTAIGIYFGFFGQKQSTQDEYLMGGKKMKVIPIALSLTSSMVTGTMFLAIPADIYQYGATIILSSIVLLPGSAIIYFVYLPVYYKLQLRSINEYLELRFNKQLRKVSSSLFGLYTLLAIPLATYSPSLAFSQVTNTNLYIIAISVSFICIFYTTIGGLKAVVWTDSLQFLIMLSAILWIIYMGIVDVGGVNEIVRRVYDGERMHIDFDPDPTKRDTFHTVFISSHFVMLGYIGINQGFVQKCLSLPSMNSVKKSVIWFCFLSFLIKIITVLSGIIIYAKYFDCNPLSSGKIKKYDQIVPLYIMDVSKSFPGVAGIFIAGLFSAGLSTMSALMNSLSCTVYEDFLMPFMPATITSTTISKILKLLVLIIGIVGIALIFLIDKMGNLFPLIYSISGITLGPLLGLFSLGMLFPKANSIGAMFGIGISLCFMTFLIIKTHIYKAQGYLSYPMKVMSVEGCKNTENVTITHSINDADSDAFKPFFLFLISHYYYVLIGALLVVIIALPISYLTKSDKVIKKDLISPISHWCMKDNNTIETKEKEYNTVEAALELVYPEKSND